eukprot:scaffold3036_cov414-Prasinococcus_capsulatus_cf.AAC.5
MPQIRERRPHVPFLSLPSALAFRPSSSAAASRGGGTSASCGCRRVETVRPRSNNRAHPSSFSRYYEPTFAWVSVTRRPTTDDRRLSFGLLVDCLLPAPRRLVVRTMPLLPATADRFQSLHVTNTVGQVVAAELPKVDRLHSSGMLSTKHKPCRAAQQPPTHRH